MKECTVDIEGLKKSLIEHAQSFGSIINTENTVNIEYLAGIEMICERFKIEADIRSLERWRHMRKSDLRQGDTYITSGYSIDDYLIKTNEKEI